MENTQNTPAQPTSDEKTWALFAHLSCVIGGWILALIVYLTQKDKGAFVKGHAIEALNWQLTVLIAYVACFILSFVFIGMFLLPVVVVCNIIFGIMGAVKSNSNGEYKYPFSIKFVK
jgi:uncharacterized Tic20 family protein